MSPTQRPAATMAVAEAAILVAKADAQDVLVVVKVDAAVAAAEDALLLAWVLVWALV